MIEHSARRALFALAALIVAPLHAASAQQPAAPRSAAQWRDDLRFMMQRLPELHANLYHATSKATFDSAAAALDARIPSLSRDEIIVGLMRIVALAHDGHTNIYPTRDRVVAFHSLPVALYLFGDTLGADTLGGGTLGGGTLIVRAADRAHADLVGASVERIGDVSAVEAYARVRECIGRDNEMDARFFAPQLLAMPEMLHALGLAPSADSARFTLRTGGALRSVWLHAEPPLPPRPGDTDNTWRRRAGWVDARDAARTPDPLWLREPPDTVLWWFTEIPGTRTGYVQINQIRNGDSVAFEDFTDRALAFVDSARIDRLVLDLRLNRGGNGDLLAPLERGLLRRPKVNSRGRLFVLMGRSTFSAAQFLLDDLHKFSEATFVGEPSGSKGNTYGDSRQIRLPNSGITVRASIYYWQDWSPTDTRQFTPPDIYAPLTLADYRANRDPVLAAALAGVPARSLRDELVALFAAGDTAGAHARFRAYMTQRAHAYADGHTIIDDAALWFYNHRDFPRAAAAFAIAESEYPNVLRSHTNAAALYELTKQPVLERRSLEQALRLAPDDRSIQARLNVLRGHPEPVQ